MFDQKTRTAIQMNTINFGDGLAGRGLGLNDTIATLRPLVTNAIPALRNLAAPKTGLRELWIALDRVASQTAPVAQANADFFSDLDTFFTALGGRRSLARTNDRRWPGGARAGDPLVRRTRRRSWKRAPSSCACCARARMRSRTSAAPLGHAFAVGAVNLRAATALNTELASASTGDSRRSPRTRSSRSAWKT